MKTMDEKAFLTEEQAESPASANPSSNCFFLRFIIRSESGMSTLFAFRSMLAGIISSLPDHSGGCNGSNGEKPILPFNSVTESEEVSDSVAVELVVSDDEEEEESSYNWNFIANS